MRKAEITLVILSIFAIAMNLLLVPYASIITVLTLSALSMIYFYLGIALFNDIKLKYALKKASYKFTSTMKIYGGIATGIALSMTTIGIMFKLQSWPGASFNLWPGLLGLTIISIIGGIKFMKDRTWFYKRIFVRVAIFGGMGLTFAIISERTLLEIKFKNHPEYVEALKKAMDEPNNNELWEAVEVKRQEMK
ncbi:MAG: hypothetical protein H0X62_12625 [Bacteroidetes bacterium]|nr:hypothetical protein [Bacteroidota bacterium]